MFEHNMTEKLTSRVELNDFNSAVIRTAVAFLYTGYMDGNPRKDYGHLVEVARFGDKYGIKQLVKVCFEELYLETNMVNVVKILGLVLAANFENKELIENLIRYVAL
jgi:hypothetical protein